jgi:hypothetical protein
MEGQGDGNDVLHTIYFRSLTWSTLPSLNTARELHTMGFLNVKRTMMCFTPFILGP